MPMNQGRRANEGAAHAQRGCSADKLRHTLFMADACINGPKVPHNKERRYAAATQTRKSNLTSIAKAYSADFE
jgi:hypothetical protein